MILVAIDKRLVRVGKKTSLLQRHIVAKVVMAVIKVGPANDREILSSQMDSFSIMDIEAN